MAIRVSGVSLVVKGFGQFVNNLKTAGNASSNLDNTLRNLQQRADSLGKRYQVASNNVLNAEANLKKAENARTAAQLKSENAFQKLDKTLSNAKAKTQDIIIAQNNHTNAIISEMGVLIDYERAVRSLENAELKQLDTQEALINANRDLTEYQAKSANMVDELNGSLAKSIPMGQDFSKILEGIGIAGSELAVILGLVAAAFITVKATIWAVQKAIEGLKWLVDTTIKVLKGLANAVISVFRFVGGIISWATRPLRTFIQHVVEIASGIALWRFIRNVGAAFRGLAEEVYQAVSAFQLLEIRLQALAARDYAAATGSTMAVAFEKTSDAAEVLFNWLRKLAVATIFDTEQISDAFTMAVAMGMNIDTSKQLTEALVNYVSAMGLTNEHMWRIIYNLGQMIQRGKLTGEELRDLARNLFPLLEIFKRLGAQSGMTAEQLKKIALEGGVPVNDFITEFIALVGEQYPGAAEKAARTIAGVTANTRDFIKTFIGMDVFKPVLDVIAGKLDDMLDKIVENKEAAKSFKLIGEILVKVFDAITPAVDAFVASLTNLWSSFTGATDIAKKLEDEMQGITSWGRTIAVGIATVAVIIRRKLEDITNRINTWANDNKTTFGITFSWMIEKAKEWGLRFVAAFASGIKGAINILTTAIKVIAQLLSFWFEPGSPPNVAPDIDKWGAATMEAWITGFTEADFSIFDDVTSLLESYFRSISDTFAKDALIPAILDMRQAIATALSAYESGRPIEFAVNIALAGIENLGAITGEFQLYLRTLLQVQQAQKIVEQAHQAVLSAQEDVNNARAALENYNNTLTRTTDAELALENASKRVKIIQDQINSVTQRYDAILSGLRNQLSQVTDEYDESVRLREIEDALSNQRLTAEERERLMMEKRSIEINRQIRSVEDQRDAEVEVLQGQLSAAELQEQAARDHLAIVEAEVEAQRKLLQAEIDLAEQRLAAANLAEEQAKDDVSRLENQADVYKKQIELVIQQNGLLNEQKKILEDIASQAEENSNLDLTPPIPQFDAVNLGNIDNIVKGIMEEAEKAANEIAGVKKEFSEAWNTSGVTEAWSQLTTSAQGLANVISILVGDKTGGEPLLTKLDRLWGNIRTNIFKVPEGENFIDWLGKKLQDNLPKIQSDTQNFFAGVRLIVDGIILLGQFANWFFEQTGIKDAVSNAGKLAYAFGIIAGSYERIYDALTPIMETKIFGKTINEWLKENSDLIENLGKVFGKFPIKSLTDLISPVKLFWNVMTEAIAAFANAMDIMADSLEKMSPEQLEDFRRIIMLTILPLVSIVNPGLAAILTGLIGAPLLTRQLGGSVIKNQPYIVGERQPELFIPQQSGFILPEIPSWMMSRPQLAAAPIYGGGDTDNSINFEIVANYKNTQSEAGIKYDVLAALAALGR